MKRVFQRLPKKLLASLAVAGAIIGVTVAARAWFPDRPTFTVAHPAPYVTFNSITDNPNYGDERTFFDAKDNVDNNSGGFANKVKVQDGETVYLRTYVHNNAADNLNDAAHQFKGVAKNAKVRIYLPTATATALRANSYISASNANPGEVADTVDFYGDLPFSLSYVPGSAVTFNNAHPQGMALNDSIVNGGAPLGYQNADGNISGCFQYVNLVTIKVKVHMQKPGMSVSKQVAIPGQPWVENVTVDPGATVSYLIGFTNTGNTQLDHVIVNDKMPAHAHIVPGSTLIVNGNHPQGTPAGSDAVVSNGIDIGSYGVGTNAFVKFKATIDSADKLNCGVNKLVNTGEAYQMGKPSVTDIADVFVSKKCKNPQPFFECTLLNVDKKDDRGIHASVNFKAENGAKLKVASYDFGDGSAPLVTDQTAVDHTYAKDGTYIVRATLTFMVNNVTKTAISEKCAQTVTFGSTTPPTTPTTPGTKGATALPNTGAGDIVGIFAAVSVAGAVAHKLFWTRRLVR